MTSILIIGTVGSLPIMHKQVKFMAKFITGIVAVALMQIAFGIFLSVERLDLAMWSAAAEATPVNDGTPDVELPFIADIYSPMFEETEIQPRFTAALRQKERYEAKNTRVIKPYGSYGRPEKTSSIYTASIRKPLKVIVTDPYAAKPAAERRTEVTQTLKIVAKSEKRSFIAKAIVPVLKKPYDWLKAVGSKLR